MKTRGFLVTWILLGAGCPETTQLTVGGEDTWKFFPLDGERTWEYQSPDTSLPYRLIAYKAKDSEAVGDTTARAYTITFTPDCLGTSAPCDVDADGDSVKDFEQQPLFTWKISSDSSRGTTFHAYNDTLFDPPVKLAGTDQSETDAVVSESGGITYTSQIIAEVPCDVPYWRGDPPEGCKVFQLDDAGADSPVAGEYMAIVQFGIVRFQQGGEDATVWELVGYDDTL